jgi:sugar phosphate isomerase/epimerase
MVPGHITGNRFGCNGIRDTGASTRGYRLRPIGAETYNRSMPRFSANLSFLFTERPFLERFAAAKAAGFAAVEFHFPYEFDRAALAEVVLTSGLEVVLFNLPPGDWAAGERGIACHPRRIAEFQDGVGQAIEYARLLAAPASTAWPASRRARSAMKRPGRPWSRTCASPPR